MPVLALDHDAEARHQLQRHLHVRLRDELVDDVDGDRFAGEKFFAAFECRLLARHSAVDRDAGAEPQIPAADRERRKAFAAEIADVGAERAQRVDQIADRTLVHARHTGELVFSA